MLKLNLAPGPVWLDLVHGVRVEVLPLTTETRIRASHDIRNKDGRMDEDGVKRDIAYVKSMARSAIIGWDGLGDADGKAVPVTPEGVDALMDIYEMYHSFQAKYVAPALVAVAEGNGSTPSPSGTSATATTTAAPAKPRAPRARASSTRRKA